MKKALIVLTLILLPVDASAQQYVPLAQRKCNTEYAIKYADEILTSSSLRSSLDSANRRAAALEQENGRLTEEIVVLKIELDKATTRHWYNPFSWF